MPTSQTVSAKPFRATWLGRTTSVISPYSHPLTLLQPRQPPCWSPGKPRRLLPQGSACGGPSPEALSLQWPQGSFPQLLQGFAQGSPSKPGPPEPQPLPTSCIPDPSVTLFVSPSYTAPSTAYQDWPISLAQRQTQPTRTQAPQSRCAPPFYYGAQCLGSSLAPRRARVQRH